MTELIWQGLQIGVLGMGLTFAALGLLILTMWILGRLFPGAEIISEMGSDEVTAVPTHDDEEEIAVAIALALNHWETQTKNQSGLGGALIQGPGSWWHAGHRQMPKASPLTKPQGKSA